MPSKGVQVCCWIACPGYSVQFSVPKKTITRNQLHDWSNDHLEVDSRNIHGLFNHTGPFTFTVFDANNQQIASKTNLINSLIGNLEAGDMTSLPQMSSIFVSGVAITFGFYDAGSGMVGLPDYDECWVTVTRDCSNWMGVAAPLGTAQAAKSSNTLVLPCAHDAGMNSMQNCMALLNNAQSITKVCTDILTAFGPVGVKIISGLAGDLAANAQNIITSLAITQKDSLTAMLQTGARYFEFRPAHISSLFGGSAPLADSLYFTHLVIPGMGFDQFLNEVITFLVHNPAEIVVIQIRFDGVHSSCKQATDAEISQYVSTALAAAPCNNTITQGTFADMSQSIDSLRTRKKRLIILTHANQYSSYSDPPYATLSGTSIEHTYPGVLQSAAAKEPGNQIAVWQCQATATNITPVAVYSAVAAIANGATSSLLCTKPLCDTVTLPWLQSNVFPTMPSKVLQAIMNDFFDGATADVAITLSQQYLNQGVTKVHQPFHA